MATQTPMWRDVSAKKKDMFNRHGVAMLNIEQVAQELGCPQRRYWNLWMCQVCLLGERFFTRLTCWPR